MPAGADDPTARATALPRGSTIVVLGGVLAGLFLAALDQTIVAAVLPLIVAELRGLEWLPWVSAGYLLASTAAVPIYGRLSDTYGRKPIALLGLGLFAAGWAACGLAPTMPLLVASRALQGLGAAALTSMAFVVVADLFEPARRARFQALFQAVFALASVVGPLAGGGLADTVGWRWAFLANVPVGLLALGVLAARMPRLGGGRRAPTDLPGAALLLLGATPLLAALTLDRRAFPWTSPTTLGLLAGGGLALALFLAVERRAAAPALPLHLLRRRIPALIVAASVAVGATFIAAILFVSLYLVDALGVGATQAGAALVPLTLSLVAGSMASSIFVGRTGRYKPVALVGLLVAAGGLWWLSTLDAASTLGDVRLRMVLVGLGAGPVAPIMTLWLQSAVPPEDLGAATAGRQFCQQLGQAHGAALLGALLTAQVAGAGPSATPAIAFAAGVAAVYRVAMWLPLVACALLALAPEVPLRRARGAGSR